MELHAFNLDLPELTPLTPDDPPRVVRAIATQIDDPGNIGKPTYYLACFIRHPDRNKRLATTKSQRAVAFAAEEMDDNLAAHGIEWDGAFQYGTPEDIAPLSEDVSLKSAEAVRLIRE